MILGHGGAHDDLSLLTSWTFDPLAVVAIAIAAFAYYRRAHTLAAPRDARSPAGGAGRSASASALVAIALFSPIDAWGEQQFFFVHMAQHVLLGELAPLAIVAGLTGPLLRPLLAYNWIHAPPRARTSARRAGRSGP